MIIPCKCNVQSVKSLICLRCRLCPPSSTVHAGDTTSSWHKPPFVNSFEPKSSTATLIKLLQSSTLSWNIRAQTVLNDFRFMSHGAANREPLSLLPLAARAFAKSRQRTYSELATFRAVLCHSPAITRRLAVRPYSLFPTVGPIECFLRMPTVWKRVATNRGRGMAWVAGFSNGPVLSVIIFRLVAPMEMMWGRNTRAF